jgi:two-component system sensor histidine kinase/response regulator
VIADEKGARKRGSGIVDILQNRYNVTNLEQTQTIKDSFDYVSQNKVYYTVATLPVISYYMQKYDYDNLQISGYLPQKYELAMAIRNDDAMLLSIIQKALDSIDEEVYNDINTRWTKIIVDKQVTHAPYSKLFILLGVIAIFFIVSNLFLQKARKKAERKAVIKSESLEKLNLALEIANLATFEYDIINDKIYLDKKLQHKLPLKEGGSIQKFISIVPKVEQKQLEFEINEAKFTDSPVFTEHYLMTKDDGYGYVNMNFKVIKRSLKGSPMKMIATILDLTKFKQLEDELFKAKEVAEKAAQSKANFLANMSHELLTPLNVIQGMSDLIKKERLSQTQLKDLQKLQSASQTLQSIINDILDFSSLESGDSQIRRSMFNLKDLIVALMQKYEKQVREKGLLLELKYDEAIAENFYADSAKIEQILDNLIANAIKFTDEGKITVSVSREKDSLYQIGVHDTGIGLGREEMEDIFESFTQVDTSDSRKYEGVGIGLALVKQLARLLNAQIKVHSKVGIGSSFIVEIPLTKSLRQSKSVRKKATIDKDSSKKIIYGDEEVMHLWDCLKEAVLTRRPKNYEPLLEKISAIKLSAQDVEKLEKVKHFLKEYDFAKTIKIIEGLNGD